MKKSIYLLVICVCFCISKNQAQSCFNITMPRHYIDTCSQTVFNIAPTIPTGWNVTSVSWLPTTGIASPTNLVTNITAPNASTVYTVTVQAGANNLVYNGDFSLGEVGYSTGYPLGTGGTWGPISNNSTYTVVANAYDAHTNFTNFYDHTTGVFAGSSMACFNGSATANTSVWCQTIAVSPNTNYTFSFWAAPCVAGSPAQLQPIINGVATGTAITLSNVPGTWTQYTASWNSGASTTASICIMDWNLVMSGNDFALDDINLSYTCTVTDTLSIKVHPININFSSTKQLGCHSDSVQFNAFNFVLGTTFWSWNFGDGSGSSVKNIKHGYTTQGIYNVTLIGNNGVCKDTVKKSINLVHPIKAQINAIDSLCLKTPLDTYTSFDVISLNSSTNASINNVYWNFGDGKDTTTFSTNAIPNVYHAYTAPGTYTLTLIVTDTLGCKDTATKNMWVENSEVNKLNALNDTVCIGQPVYFSDSLTSITPFFWYTFQDNSDVNKVYNTHNPVHTFTNSGTWNVTLSSLYKKCVMPDSVLKVTIRQSPNVYLGPDTNYCAGVSPNIILKNLAFNSFPTKDIWNTGEFSGQIFGNAPGYYWLTVTDTVTGCTATDSVFVKNECYINIPNSFTPDGDGLNDYFLPRELLSAGVLSFTMDIYNRWGERIFTTNNIDGRGWDGKFGDKEQPMGTFVYTIKVALLDGTVKLYNGNVTLLR